MVFQALCTSRDDCHMWAHQGVRCLYLAKTCHILWILQKRPNAWTRTCCRAPCAQADFSNTARPLATCQLLMWQHDAPPPLAMGKALIRPTSKSKNGNDCNRSENAS